MAEFNENVERAEQELAEQGVTAFELPEDGGIENVDFMQFIQSLFAPPTPTEVLQALGDSATAINEAVAAILAVNDSGEGPLTDAEKDLIGENLERIANEVLLERDGVTFLLQAAGVGQPDEDEDQAEDQAEDAGQEA